MRRVAFPFLLVATLLVASFAHAQEDLEALLNDGGSAEATSSEVVGKKGLAGAVNSKIQKKGPDQLAFLRAVETESWDQAILLFTKAFENSPEMNSSWGRALQGLLQFNAGLQVTGVETLFTATRPAEIKGLEIYWQKAAPQTHFVWELARVAWSEGWTAIFDKNIEFLVKVNQVETLENVAALEQLAKDSPPESVARARAEWNLVLAYSLGDKADLAAKLLAKLMKNPKSPATEELMKLTAARLLFQNGYFDASTRYYDQVSKKSEYWVEAQEEMGWAHIRKGDPQNAIAITKSLSTPAFANQLRAETYLVGSLASLKVCDYTAVAQTLEVFPKNFKERTKLLEGIASGEQISTFAPIFERLKNKKLQAKDLGEVAAKLPRLTVRDGKIFQQAQAVKRFEAEAKVAERIYALSIAATGLQGVFESLAKNLNTRAQSAQAAAHMRVRDLAKVEVEETKSVLRKLHIVEAEMVQQVMVSSKSDTKAAPENKKGTTGAKGNYTLTFPADSEVWFDEIGHYKVDVKKACLNQGAKVVK